ncbi:unnamed protein product, partial [marine sediment metagenome]
TKVKTPYEVLQENNENYTMHYRFKQVESKYQELLKKAVSAGKKQGKMLFFQYGGDLSMSSDLANELGYFFPDKTIVVVYIKGVKANISIRGKKSRDILLEAIKDLKEVSGGGHETAVGGQIRFEDLEKFRENLKKQIQ